MAPDLLVVDDDSQMAALVASYLKTQGLAATAVTSGADAVAALDRQAFSVVVTDLVGGYGAWVEAGLPVAR